MASAVLADRTIADSEYGLSESGILSAPWLSASSLSDVLARPAVFTASAEHSPVLRKVAIRRQGAQLRVDVRASRPLSHAFLKGVEAVVALLRLPEGWDSYSAKPINLQTAVYAIRLLARYVGPQTPLPAVVPRIQGAIQLEWHTETVDIEVYIDSPGKVSFFAEHPEAGDGFEGPLAGHEQILKEWVQRVSEG
jgi:hypothetical protein